MVILGDCDFKLNLVNLNDQINYSKLFCDTTNIYAQSIGNQQPFCAIPFIENPVKRISVLCLNISHLSWT
ncbi:hypothetical protein Avbf_15887 [Armadillidium vulgare]|nr:hypothetical protein Avbf_15887 [Armadillidium vulgare]